MPASYWITAIATAAAVVACVTVHYDCLRFLSRGLARAARIDRHRIVLLILCLLLLHIAEIWTFGVGYYLLLANGSFGELIGHPAPGLLDCVYYSATVFTTLGFGDFVPTGPIRFMTGTESLAGLTFITWSASYTYLVMEKTWKFDHD